MSLLLPLNIEILFILYRFLLLKSCKYQGGNPCYSTQREIFKACILLLDFSITSSLICLLCSLVFLVCSLVFSNILLIALLNNYCYTDIKLHIC